MYFQIYEELKFLKPKALVIFMQALKHRRCVHGLRVMHLPSRMDAGVDVALTNKL